MSSLIAPLDNSILKTPTSYFENIFSISDVPSVPGFQDVLSVSYIANNGVANGYTNGIPATIRRSGKIVQVVIGTAGTSITIAGAATTDVIFTQVVGGTNTELVGLEPATDITCPVIIRDGGTVDIVALLCFRTLLDGSYKIGLRKQNGATFNIASSFTLQRGMVLTYSTA